MTDLAHRRSTSVTPARRASRGRLMTTVAVSTLAAVVFFAVFYVIGVVVGLALIAALGVALLIGGVWLSLKFGRRAPSAPRAPPTPLP